MRRRSFIGRMFAGLAALPLLGRLAQARTGTVYRERGFFMADGGRIWHRYSVTLGPTNQIKSVYIDGVKADNFHETIYHNNPQTNKPWTEYDISECVSGLLRK